METQLLLTRRPIVCTRCMHGHQVEVITGREKTPVEYHCGCGNYAIVGVPARWPFMEVVIGPKSEIKNIEISKNIKPDHDDTGSSPMQVGEKLRKQEEPMSTFKCKHPGCDKRGAVAGYCNNHFRELYGITAEQYRAEKSGRKEDPETVAERVREYSLVASKTRVDRASETFHAAMEEEKGKTMSAPKPETKPPTNVAKPEKEEARDTALIEISCDLYEKIVQLAEQEYRPVAWQVQYLLHKGMEAVKG